MLYIRPPSRPADTTPDSANSDWAIKRLQSLLLKVLPSPNYQQMQQVYLSSYQHYEAKFTTHHYLYQQLVANIQQQQPDMSAFAAAFHNNQQHQQKFAVSIAKIDSICRICFDVKYRLQAESDPEQVLLYPAVVDKLNDLQALETMVKRQLSDYHCHLELITAGIGLCEEILSRANAGVSDPKSQEAPPS